MSDRDVLDDRLRAGVLFPARQLDEVVALPLDELVGTGSNGRLRVACGPNRLKMSGRKRHVREGVCPLVVNLPQLEMQRVVVHNRNGLMKSTNSVVRVHVSVEAAERPCNLSRLGHHELKALEQPVSVQGLAVVERDAFFELELDGVRAARKEAIGLGQLGLDRAGHVVQRCELSVDEARSDSALERGNHVGDQVCGKRADRDGNRRGAAVGRGGLKGLLGRHARLVRLHGGFLKSLVGGHEGRVDDCLYVFGGKLVANGALDCRSDQGLNIAPGQLSGLSGLNLRLHDLADLRGADGFRKRGESGLNEPADVG